jgi:DNA-binding transcriptional ArsR family regulator
MQGPAGDCSKIVEPPYLKQIMREIHHPSLDEVALSTVLHALSDPIRLQIVKTLGCKGEQCCGACAEALADNIPKPTLSHHFKVLREAGIIAVRLEGTQRCISLRCHELNARFPGLLPAVLHAAESV